jgi:hypothetical protein
LLFLKKNFKKKRNEISTDVFSLDFGREKNYVGKKKKFGGYLIKSVIKKNKEKKKIFSVIEN